MENKRGSEKYYIIISLILGLIVLSLSLYFIFHEYFTKEEIDWEACRQSIILRSTIPTSKKPIFASIDDLREAFPLKCKTEVIEVDLDGSKINWDDNSKEGKREKVKAMLKFQEEISKVVADALVRCWALVGEGKYDIFPIDIAQGKYALLCSRIHFSKNTQLFDSNIKSYVDKNFAINIPFYLTTHDMNGNKIENFKQEYEKTIFHYLGGGFNMSQDKLVLVDDDNFDKILEGKVEYGPRSTIDVSKGDVIVGVYYYNNIEVFKKIVKGITGKGKLEFRPELEIHRFPFYYQPSLDSLGDTNIETIPA